MTAKANDMPLCVDFVHAERPERHLFNYLKKSCLFCRRHSPGFEHEAIGRAFHREEVLLGKPSRHYMLDSPTPPSGSFPSAKPKKREPPSGFQWR